MNKIYCLIGKLTQSFQHIEEYLSLSIYLYDTNTREFLLKHFLSIETKSLGLKLNTIKKLQILEENDITVLEYIKNKRNYIIHRYFLENNFTCKLDIKQSINELSALLKEIQLIERALKKSLKK